MQGKGEQIMEYIKSHSGEYIIWRDYLAEHKEVSRTTLFKWLKRWKSEGVIESKGKRITVNAK